MSFPNKEQRAKCWSSRDEYWKCLDQNSPQHSSTSGESVPNACKQMRKLFETSCPSQWVKHFDRKRTYEQFKAKMQEGYDPIPTEQKSTKSPGA
ncbi:cytochrome c oxidase assembly factor 6 homolog [Teleopsis dalmanni]|uniref:cytochrome c oxidase assembly factor 6 homolog n=1 Tax=Teleopsis dalmanni TaxID=139649 RepID=UPI0018CE3BAB|nr:cytochrome c oxidase assembly factor 6 homolog [Teleopsis dalmanni]